MVFVVSYLEYTGFQTHEAIHFHCLYYTLYHNIEYCVLPVAVLTDWRLSSNLERIRTYRANNLNRLLE